MVRLDGKPGMPARSAELLIETGENARARRRLSRDLCAAAYGVLVVGLPGRAVGCCPGQACGKCRYRRVDDAGGRRELLSRDRGLRAYRFDRRQDDEVDVRATLTNRGPERVIHLDAHRTPKG